MKTTPGTLLTKDELLAISQELRAANRQDLADFSQELRQANRQDMQAIGQEIRAANKQDMAAVEQRLASKDELQAMEQRLASKDELEVMEQRLNQSFRQTMLDTINSEVPPIVERICGDTVGEIVNDLMTNIQIEFDKDRAANAGNLAAIRADSVRNFAAVRADSAAMRDDIRALGDKLDNVTALMANQARQLSRHEQIFHARSTPHP